MRVDAAHEGHGWPKGADCDGGGDGGDRALRDAVQAVRGEDGGLVERELRVCSPLGGEVGGRKGGLGAAEGGEGEEVVLAAAGVREAVDERRPGAAGKEAGELARCFFAVCLARNVNAEGPVGGE